MGDLLTFVLGFWFVIFAIVFLIVAWKLALVVVGLPVSLFLLLHPDTGGYFALTLMIALAVFIWKENKQQKAEAKKLEALRKKRKEERRLEQKQDDNDLPLLSDALSVHSSV